METALAAHTDLPDAAAFDSLQRALDAAAPLVSQCGDRRSTSEDASLEFARDRFLFGYAPVIPPADPACASVPANPTTADERLRVAQCEYTSQMTDVTKTQLYLERRKLLAKMQTLFDTLTASGYVRSDPAEYAADRAFLVAARISLAAEAVSLPSPAPSAAPAATSTP